MLLTHLFERKAARLEPGVVLLPGETEEVGRLKNITLRVENNRLWGNRQEQG
jgi:hypothetical protein